VRTSAERHGHVDQPPVIPAGEWTPYAFTLDAIEANVRWAIKHGTPDGPGAWHLVEDISRPAVDGKWAQHVVPTRWTSAYRGRRDLGVQWLPDAQMTRACQTMALDWVAAMSYEEMDRWRLAREPIRQTLRDRQRAANAEFQAAHLLRRAAGLRARHAEKLGRNMPGGNASA
jgi:hypothetical protein